MQLYLTIQGHVNFTQMARFGHSCESRFRDDVRLNYLYAGPKTRKRGRPQKFSGRVNVNNLDMSVFNTMHIADGCKCTDAFWADVWSVSLERMVRVVILDCRLTCQARSKEVLSFAFNMSLTSINVAREFARQNHLDLSIGSIKTLLHNAAMLERFISMFGKSPNIKLNNTNFKELLFYGVRNAS